VYHLHFIFARCIEQSLTIEKKAAARNSRTKMEVRIVRRRKIGDAISRSLAEVVYGLKSNLPCYTHR